jgi:hypothetical protein
VAEGELNKNSKNKEEIFFSNHLKINKMDKGNRMKVNMFTLVALYFTKYATLFTDYAQLVLEITGFKAVLVDMGIDIGVQTKDTKGVTADKNILVSTAVQLTVDTARKARVYAENVNDTKLEHTYNIHVSDFHNGDSKTVLEALTVVSKAIGDNMAKFVGYKIVAADVTAIDAAIAAAMEDLGKSKQAIKERSTSTGNIAVNVDKGMAYLHKIDDLLISEYKNTNPKEVAEYKLNRQEEPIGTHHTGIRPLVTSTGGELLHDALVSIPELKRDTLTNYDGIGELIKFKTGTYSIEVSKDGFIGFKTIMKVPRGKIVEFTVILLPKVLVVMATKKGLPAKEYSASVVDTDVQAMTNAAGMAELPKAPNKGVLELSNENGDFYSLPYDMGGMDRLVINVEIS